MPLVDGNNQSVILFMLGRIYSDGWNQYSCVLGVTLDVAASEISHKLYRDKPYSYAWE